MSKEEAILFAEGLDPDVLELYVDAYRKVGYEVSVWKGESPIRVKSDWEHVPYGVEISDGKVSWLGGVIGQEAENGR